MEVLQLLQTQIDSILVVAGIVLFLIFMTSSRLYVLAVLAGLLIYSRPASAFEIHLDKITSTNVLISGFTNGRIYQVTSVGSLTDTNTPKTIALHCPTSSAPFSFVPGVTVSQTVSSFPDQWVVADPLNPDSTNLVFMPAHTVTNPVRVVGYYRAWDITTDFKDLSDRKDFALGTVVGLGLFFCFGRSLV